MRDRTFAPTVLLGLGAAALTAVSAGQEWARTTGDAAGVEVSATVAGSDTAPLGLALALVALAAWGVLLVLRGRLRRAVACVGALAAAGVQAVLVDAFDGAQGDSVAAVMAEGATGDVFVSTLTAWYWATGVAALVTLAAFVVAVARSPAWPAMGTRYESPAWAGRGDATDSDGSHRSPEDMWRALDHGRDPTT